MVEVAAPAPEKAKRKTPPSGFHHTRGVYGNGEFKDNGVSPDHIDDHIEYNLVMRPGRAFFVDGVCLNRGYLSDEACRKVEEQLAGVKADRCTAPYR